MGFARTGTPIAIGTGSNQQVRQPVAIHIPATGNVHARRIARTRAHEGIIRITQIDGGMAAQTTGQNQVHPTIGRTVSIATGSTDPEIGQPIFIHITGRRHRVPREILAGFTDKMDICIGQTGGDTPTEARPQNQIGLARIRAPIIVVVSADDQV